MDTEVLVVIGVGGIGQAIARRQRRAPRRPMGTLQVRWHVDLYAKNLK